MTARCVIEAFVGSCILWAIISFLPLKPSIIESISCRFNVVQFTTVFHFPLIYTPKTKVLKVALDTGCLAVRTHNLVSFSFEKFLFWIKSGLKQIGLSIQSNVITAKLLARVMTFSQLIGQDVDFLSCLKVNEFILFSYKGLPSYAI